MKRGKKKFPWVIILIIALILIIAAVICYFLFFNGGLSFKFGTPDFSKGTELGNIGDSIDANAWDNAKLNPFAEGG